MQDNFTSGHGGQNITPEGLYLMDGIEGLRSLPRHSVDMLLTDPPYGTTRNYWDVPLPLPELWEAVRWAVKPEGAVLLFAQCPYDKALGASNLPMLRYECQSAGRRSSRVQVFRFSQQHRDCCRCSGESQIGRASCRERV